MDVHEPTGRPPSPEPSSAAPLLLAGRRPRRFASADGPSGAPDPPRAAPAAAAVGTHVGRRRRRFRVEDGAPHAAGDGGCYRRRRPTDHRAGAADTPRAALAAAAAAADTLVARRRHALRGKAFVPRIADAGACYCHRRRSPSFPLAMDPLKDLLYECAQHCVLLWNLRRQGCQQRAEAHRVQDADEAPFFAPSFRPAIRVRHGGCLAFLTAARVLFARNSGEAFQAWPQVAHHGAYVGFQVRLDVVVLLL
mmetsp:Transcript_114635/g.331285  ORF Transcript_114635/g.331285 Transcript_114635/m.331285 type:complete len:251 (+) Transcript_114635:202-954(+)